jgi:hypothetical protein
MIVLCRQIGDAKVGNQVKEVIKHAGSSAPLGSEGDSWIVTM